jgi:adenosylmethionine-8-amino-7-oxononanoate aminotransferase
MIVCAKGLGAGYYPVFCVITTEAVHRAIKEGNGNFVHGHTYSQNPLACATALAVLDYIEKNDLVRSSERLGAYLLDKLQVLYRHEMVGDVRGIGLFAGVEFVRDRKTKEPFPPARKVNALVSNLAFDNGLIVYPGGGGADGVNGDHILIAPPFIITEGEIDKLVSILDEAIGETERSL